MFEIKTFLEKHDYDRTNLYFLSIQGRDTLAWMSHQS